MIIENFSIIIHGLFLDNSFYSITFLGPDTCGHDPLALLEKNEIPKIFLPALFGQNTTAHSSPALREFHYPS